MGSYGLGPSRLMGTLVEVFADEKGLVWPESVAPFLVHLLPLGGEEVASAAQALYDKLSASGIEVLLNDREESAGEKFSDADLLGLPYRVVLSEKTRQAGQLELKVRKNGETKMLAEDELLSFLQEKNVQ